MTGIPDVYLFPCEPFNIYYFTFIGLLTILDKTSVITLDICKAFDQLKSYSVNGDVNAIRSSFLSVSSVNIILSRSSQQHI